MGEPPDQLYESVVHRILQPPIPLPLLQRGSQRLITLLGSQCGGAAHLHHHAHHPVVFRLSLGLPPIYHHLLLIPDTTGTQWK